MSISPSPTISPVRLMIAVQAAQCFTNNIPAANIFWLKQLFLLPPDINMFLWINDTMSYSGLTEVHLLTVTGKLWKAFIINSWLNFGKCSVKNAQVMLNISIRKMLWPRVSFSVFVFRDIIHGKHDISQEFICAIQTGNVEMFSPTFRTNFNINQVYEVYDNSVFNNNSLVFHLFHAELQRDYCKIDGYVFCYTAASFKGENSYCLAIAHNQLNSFT